VEDPSYSAGIVEFALAEASRLNLPITMISCIPPEPALRSATVDQTVLDAQRAVTRTVEEWQPKFLTQISDELVRDMLMPLLPHPGPPGSWLSAPEDRRFRGLHLAS
jgi:hypothetical protein